MNILLAFHKSPNAAGGGILSYVFDLTKALERIGHRVIWCAPGPGTPAANDRDFIEVIPADSARNNALKVLDALDAYSVDAVVNNDNPVVQMLAPALGVPFLAVAHYGSKVIASLAAYQHSYVDHVIAISHDMHKELVKRFEIPVWKCPIVHTGVETAPHDHSGRTNPGPLLQVCFAGGLTRYKGADLIRQVLPRLTGVAHLHWFGVGPQRARELGLPASGVTYHGQVPRGDFLKRLKSLDAILFPSREEGCPMALLEAMCAGLAPIASDGKGAMKEIILSGYHGFLCSIRNWPEEASSCIEFLARHRGRLAEMQGKSRVRVRNRFSSDTVAARIVSLIASPTVDRSAAQKTVPLIRWHRWPDPSMSTIADKARFHLGLLKRDGTLTL